MTMPEPVDQNDDYLDTYRNAMRNCDVRLASGTLTPEEVEDVTAYRANIEADLNAATARLAEAAQGG